MQRHHHLQYGHAGGVKTADRGPQGADAEGTGGLYSGASRGQRALSVWASMMNMRVAMVGYEAAAKMHSCGAAACAAAQAAGVKAAQ